MKKLLTLLLSLALTSVTDTLLRYGERITVGRLLAAPKTEVFLGFNCVYSIIFDCITQSLCDGPCNSSLFK